MSLNQAQREAVSHHMGPCMVLAGPGSGKTLTIAKRIEYLIQKLEVRPEEILVITFTKYAANEMRDRFRKVMGGKHLPVTFGTFHGIYYGILKWAYHLTQENILTEEEKFALLKEIAAKSDWSGDEDLIQSQDFIQELAEEIGNVKNNLKDIDTYISKQYGMGRFRSIYKSYEETKQKFRKIDFEDMLVMTLKLFRGYPDVLKKWQQKYKYILVDEFQDINQAQYEVIRLLAAPENNLFIVGDDDQSVYGFRGAKPGIMLEFKKDYPDTKQVVLNVNYRSTAHIVNGALRVIRNNRLRYPKEIKANHKADKTVHVQEVKDVAEEAHYILDKIREAMKAGQNLEEIAVLFRTATDARVIAELLIEYQIPFHMKEHLNNLYDHFIGQDIYSYLKLSQKEFERKYFLQVINRPNRFIARDSLEGRVSYESIRRFYCDKEWMINRVDQLEWDMKMIENKPPYAAIQYLRKSVGYDEFLKEYASFRQMNLEELRDVLDEIQERAKEFKTISEWFAHVDSYKDMLKEQAKNAQGNEGVALLTMHGAKGLEFDTVYVIAANEGIIPYKKAQLEDEIEEERRLFYVAMTRAKKQLTISYTKEKNGKAVKPSRFVGELFRK